MATLYFKIGADFDKVIRLRDEIKKLENQLKSFGTSTPNAEIKRTEERLASSRQEFTRLATEAAKAGAVMESDLKRKINSVTKASDELSEEIIKQRKIIRETQDDVRRLSEQYSKMSKLDMKSSSTLNQLNKAKAALAEQRYAMGDLQDQQARNRLELRKLNREYAEFSQGSDRAKMAAESFMSSLKQTAAEIGGLAAIKQFTSQVINATGTMQQLQVALSTILQDEGRAKELIGEITQFAARTPFNLDDVASGAKQLLAYGSSAENVVEELSMLGDVASGLQIPIGQLIYLYGTLRTQGRAMTVDIRQFAGRGIPIYEELAKVLGVSKDQVGELVKEGKVGFKEVEQAFKNMTSEGGKFNDLMENSAGTWPQRISNMQDKLFQSMNDFGNRYKEIFESGMDITEGVVDHLEDILSVLIPLIAAYGTYRAALIAVGVAQKAAGFVENIRLIAMMRKEIGLATAAQQAFNVASKANVYVATASAIIALGTAIYMFAKRTDETTESQKRLQEAQEEYRKSVDAELAQMDRLFDNLKKAKKGTDDYQEAKDAIVENYGSYLNGLDEEIRTLKNVEGAYDAVRKAIVKTARARGMDAAVKGAQEAYGDLYGRSSGKLYDALEKEVGRDRAKSLVSQVSEQIRKQGTISKSLQDEVASVFRGTYNYGQSKAWMKGMVNATKELNDTYEKAESIFGEGTDSKGSGGTGNTVTVKNKSYWEKKKKEAEEARDALDISKRNSDEWEKYTNQIREAENQIAKYSSPSKVGKDADKATEKRKKAQEKLDKALLALQQKNQDDEIALMQDGTKKKLAEIGNDYKKRVAEIGKQEEEFKKKNQEAGATGLTGGLTKEQAAELRKARENAAKEQERQTAEVYQAEAGAMRDYLKQYGTYQQQKLAIAEEYAEKIKNAQTEGERLSLEAERDRSLQQVEINAIKRNIDWGSVFGDFGAMFKDQLQPTIDQLMQIAGSDTFKQSSLEDQKTLYELIDKLEKSNAVWDSDIFKRVSDDMEAYQQSLARLIDAQERERAAIANYENARKSLDAARETGDKEKIEKAGKAVESASAEMEAASSDVREFGSQAQKATADLNASSEQARTMFEGLAEGLRGLSSGTIQGVWEGLSRLDTLFNEGDMTKDIGNALAKGIQSLFGKDSSVAKSLSDALGNSGALGAIISAILSIIDQLAEQGIGGIVSSLIDTVLGAVNGILENVLKGKFIEQIGNSLVDGIGGILNTISFGGLDSLMNIGSNAKEVAETINRLTERNKLLQQSIEDLTSTIEGGEGTRSVTAYEEAVRLQEEMEQNLLEMARAQAGYSGSHHSWNAYWGGFTPEEIAELSRRIGRDWNGDLFDLSPDEMKELRSMVDTWARIQNTGKGGYGGRLTEKLDDYIEQAGQMEELTDQLNESLTQVSFDSLYDSFIDTLMDMDASAEDFANDFSEYMMRALLSNQVGEEMKKQLEDWYGKWAEYMKDNKLTDMELSDLRGEWDNMVEEGMALRDQLAAAIGYDGENDSQEQQASAGYTLATSQESVDVLNGRLNAVYECELRIEEQGRSMVDVSSEIRSIIAQSYLELQQISENTGAIIVPIQKMQKDIEQVKKNTANL